MRNNPDSSARKRESIVAINKSTTQRFAPTFLVTIAILAGLVAAFHMGKIPGALPLIGAELSLDLTRSGLIVSSFSLLAAGFGLVIGILSGRLGMRRAGILGLLLAAAGSGLGAISPGYYSLLGSRVVEGLGFVLVAITMPGIINAVCPPARRAIALGIWGAFIPAAMSLALIVSPTVLKSVGWQGLWLGLAALTLFWCVLFAWSFSRAGLPQPFRQLSWKTVSPLFRGNPLLVVGTFTCYSMAFAAFTTFLPTYWVDQGVSLGTASKLAAFAVAGNIVGNIFAGYLVGRGIPLRPLMTSALLGGGASAALVFSGLLSLPMEFVAALGFTAFSGLLPGAVMANLAGIAPDMERIPLLVGLVFQGAGIGQVIGPVTLGATVGMAASWQGASLCMLAIAAVGIVLSSQLAGNLRNAPLGH